MNKIYPADNQQNKGIILLKRLKIGLLQGHKTPAETKNGTTHYTENCRCPSSIQETGLPRKTAGIASDGQKNENIGLS